MVPQWHLTPIGEIRGPFRKPATVEVVSPNEIYVVDDSDTSPTTTWGGGRRVWRVTEVAQTEIPLPDPGFDPDDIAVGHNGALYVYHSGEGENCLRLEPDGSLRQILTLGEGLSRVAVDRLGRIWAGYVEPPDQCWLKLFEANGRLLWSSADPRFRVAREQLGPIRSVYDIALGEGGVVYLALGREGAGATLAHLGRDRRLVAAVGPHRLEEPLDLDCLTLTDHLLLATPARAAYPWLTWDGRSDEVGFIDLEVDGLRNPYVSALSSYGDLICACIPQLCRLLILRLEQG